MLELTRLINVVQKINSNKVTNYAHLIETLKKKLTAINESEYTQWQSSQFSQDFQFTLSYKTDTKENKENKYTLLHVAAIAQCEKIVGFLLQNGASIETQDNDGNTPLHLAVLKGYGNIVDKLLEVQVSINPKAPIPINRKNNEGNAPLHLAVKNNHKHIVEKLLAAHALIDIKNNEGNTPLHLAVLKGYGNIVDTLLNAQVPINIQNNEGNTLLHLAVTNASKHIVHKLLKQLQQKPNIVNILNNSGKTALDLAMEKKGNDAIIKLLTQYGAKTSKDLTNEEKHALPQKQKIPQAVNAPAPTVKEEPVELEGKIKLSPLVTSHTNSCYETNSR